MILRTGKIITFYSYKGGTGRSMALANVAWILASRGKKVLAIDWDLEAPGLHRYFLPFLADRQLASSPGVIDFVSEFVEAALTPQPEGDERRRDWHVPYADLTRYATSLEYKFLGGGRLDFIPAGQQDASYATRVNSFDWKDFYERAGGGVFLNSAREKLRSEYDYVLIDSRTGVSDTSGITTVQLPDTLVICFTLNNQGIEGTAAIAESVAAQRAGANTENLRLFPVPMRLDPFEKESLELRRELARRKFAAHPAHLSETDRENFRKRVNFPYVPYYSYEETLAVFGDKAGEEGTVLAAAEALTGYLTEDEITRLEPIDDTLRKELAARYKTQLPARMPEYDLILAASPPDQAWAEQLADRLGRENWLGRKLRVYCPWRNSRPGDTVGSKFGFREVLCRTIALVLSPGAGERWIESKELAQLLLGTESLRCIPLVRGPVKMPLELRTVISLDVAEDVDAQYATQVLRALIVGDPIPTNVPKVAAPIEPDSQSLRDRFRPNRPEDNIAAARKLLRSRTAPFKNLLALAGELRDSKEFGYARQILELASHSAELASDPARRLKLAQKRAVTTYKDPDLPRRRRLEMALAILTAADDLAITVDQESLGIAGAIFKRKWDTDGETKHLERALEFYLRGYQQGPAKDFGYTGINAAFVLDVLASLEPRGSPSTDARQRQAAAIRRDLLDQLLNIPDQESNWWYLCTIAEAFFGLGRFDEASHWLRLAAAFEKITAWEFEATSRQLATIARLQDERLAAGTQPEASGAWAALNVFLAGNADAVRTAYLGKTGLALSGGGFRASLFHIGVLARLAELDMLRHIEVLSCVSGGSIIGAHYYLEVRRLLQTTADDKITPGDYVAIVQRMSREFLGGVQRNLRTRAGTNLVFNLKMIFSPAASRTRRLGELYEEELYSRVPDNGGRVRWLNELRVTPVGESASFNPKHDNWRRRNKVPILILNATTLNTGHTWQFTATWMGEPPTYLEGEIDSTERLRRVYYKEAPPPHQRIRLGHAVAASACVPGLFEPIVLEGLYPRRSVALVDGGVHDNQGVRSLSEQDCTVLLVSDASGQLNSDQRPRSPRLNIYVRSYDVIMARVREEEARNLQELRASSRVRSLMFLHLKRGLGSAAVPWNGCADPVPASPTKSDLTTYNVRKDLQEKLAAIRTDLDSFSDQEAFALMTSGYRMTEHEFATSVKNFPVPSLGEVRGGPSWNFLAIEKALGAADADNPDVKQLDRLLKTASHVAFKVWRLSFKPWLVLLATVVLFIYMDIDNTYVTMALRSCYTVLRELGIPFIALSLIWEGDFYSSSRTAPDPPLAIVAGGAALLYLELSLVISIAVTIGSALRRLIWHRPATERFRDVFLRTFFRAATFPFFWILSLIHLALFNRLYLHIGRVAPAKPVAQPQAPKPDSIPPPVA